MAYNSVIKIKNKSWTAGFGKDKSKGNYHVGQKELEFEVTWKSGMRPEFYPFVDAQGHQGMRVKITKIIDK